MAYTYPAAGPSLSGDTLTISRFLNNPASIARRLRDLTQQRFIADYLLSGRFEPRGGAILYETGESIYTADNPISVSAGGEYPLTTAATGTAAIAKVVKWGQDAVITDESIEYQGINPVEKAMTKLANQNVKYVDSVALAAVSSQVTSTVAATASWSTASAAQILKDVGQAKASILALNQGYDPDTVVVDDANWMYAMVAFVAAGYVPRETMTDNPTITGDFPTILGMKWLPTPNLPTAGQVLVADHNALGGMADQKLGGPGYSQANGTNVQVKTIREDHTDQWRLRARRVVVPVVVEPAAAKKITGV